MAKHEENEKRLIQTVEAIGQHLRRTAKGWKRIKTPGKEKFNRLIRKAVNVILSTPPLYDKLKNKLKEGSSGSIEAVLGYYHRICPEANLELVKSEDENYRAWRQLKRIDLREMNILYGHISRLKDELLAPLIQESSSKTESPQQTKTRADWRDVQERLLRLREAGEAYTSQRDFAERLNCSEATINKAVNKSPELKGWMARHVKRSPKAQSLNEVVADNIPSQREQDPAVDGLPDDEADLIFAELLQEDITREQRADLNAMDPERRREMAKLYLQQKADKHIEEKALKGNQILGRKP